MCNYQILEGYEDSVRDGNGLLKSLISHACKEYNRNNENKIARVTHCVTQPYLTFLDIKKIIPVYVR